MARLFYLGPPSAVQLPANASIADLMARLGRNTGNLLIGDAIMRHLEADTLCRPDDLLRREGTQPLALEVLDSRLIETTFDVIVIGAANFLHHGFDFGRWANFLESVRLPCVIIGLGAQAPSQDSHIDVPEGTQRLVKIIAERSTSLGVRGHFTATILNDMGIKNVRVIGCPSMYWTCQPALQLKERPAHEHLAVSLNGSANVVDHSVDAKAATKVEAMIARLSLEHGYPYVLQNETEMMEILTGAPGACEPSLIGVLMNRYGLSDISAEAFISFVRQNMRVYTDTGTWLAAVERSDFVLGTRFHGCLTGLLAGVACFAFVHDARTREMCELLRIPHADVRDVVDINVRALYDSLDLESLQTQYSGLYQNYIDFLDENRLAHRLTR